MAKLTDTQLPMLSKSSQRADRGVELSANLKGGTAHKVVDRLIRNGLLEEIRARGTLPVWRRDDNNGRKALRLTRHGLYAIAVEPEETTAAADPDGGTEYDLNDVSWRAVIIR
jgi:hypothetical protein